MKKTEADNFFEALKDNPQEVIEWAEAEIKEYKKLIKLIKKSVKPPRKPVIPINKVLV